MTDSAEREEQIKSTYSLQYIGHEEGSEITPERRDDE